MSEKIAFSMNNVAKIVPPNKAILSNVNLSFYYGAKIGVLGINGSGKSTLLKIISGEEKDFDGELSYDKNLSIGFLPQEPQLDESKTVSENIKEGMKDTLLLLQKFEELTAKMGEELSDDVMEKVLAEMGEVQEKLEKKDAWEMERKIEVAMDALRVPSDENAISQLSGGERRRVSLCRLLMEAPDILILDEPTNHLDAESVTWIENYLKEFSGTVITVTHDRYFLDNVAQWILELDRGRTYPYKGNYAAWLKQKQQRLQKEESSESNRQKSLKSELEWINKNAKGQQTKSKARIKAYENLLVEQNKVVNSDKMEINIPTPPRLGEKVIQLKNINKSFEGKLLIENLSLDIPRGAIVGIIGPNGVGKTTLFKMIYGTETPDSGSVVVGETVQLSYVEQFRDSLSAQSNIWEAISEGEEQIDLGNRKIHSRAYVGSFNFKGTEQQKKVGTLSGGERNRVHLARLLKSGGNVLLLDEPTNDLDVATLRSLEDALLSFAGCVLVISHDRYFLDRISTHIISFEENAKIEYRMGNFTEYEQWKVETYGEDSIKPKRIKYRRIQ